MFDDLEAQFFENVLPAYEAFCAALKTTTAGQNSDLRLGKDAAIALFHLREHVPWARGKTWPANLAGCAEYTLLQDIVNVFKHGSRRDGQVANATDIYEVVVLTEYQDADGPYQHLEKKVTVDLRDKSVRELKNILTGVLKMWIADFKAHGLLQRFDASIQAQSELIPTRASKSGGAPLDLTALQGVRFRQSFRLQKYNYATRQIEAVDMSQQNFVFTISEPLRIDVNMTHKITGQVIEGSLELTQEEEIEYLNLRTDSEREEFGKKLENRCRALLDDRARQGKL